MLRGLTSSGADNGSVFLDTGLLVFQGLDTGFSDLVLLWFFIGSGLLILKLQRRACKSKPIVKKGIF